MLINSHVHFSGSHVFIAQLHAPLKLRECDTAGFPRKYSFSNVKRTNELMRYIQGLAVTLEDYIHLNDTYVFTVKKWNMFFVGFLCGEGHQK